MTESSKQSGVVAALLKRFETQRLPLALELKDKVDRGERLTDWDMAFMEQVQQDSQQIKALVDKNPEYQELYARAVMLYTHILDKALENERS